MTTPEPQAGPETARKYVDKLLSATLEAEPEAGPVPYTLTPRAEAVLEREAEAGLTGEEADAYAAPTAAGAAGIMDVTVTEADAIAAEMEQDRLARQAEADLGHDYDGPELRSGTPEYEALYAEYQAWAAEPEPEPEWDCADSNAYQARVEAGLEPEAEL